MRIFVDDIHIDAHDRQMTYEEADWAAQLQAAVATGGDTAPLAWARTANRFGPRRAAYLLRPDTTVPPRTTAWQRAAIAGCLPDPWLVVAYGPNRTPLAAGLSQPIASPLQVGPDPSYMPPPPAAGQPSPPPPLDQVGLDPGLKWLVDFNTAESSGMALRVPLDGGTTWPTSGPLPGMPTLSRVVVVGVRATDAAADFASLLTAHRYTDGLEAVVPGTPTNNTADAPSGFASSDPGFAHAFDLEVTIPAAAPPSGDSLRLAGALGLTASTTLAGAGAPLGALADQQAAMTLAWPATWGYFLSRMTTLAADRVDRARSWSSAWVRPGGPLPALRIGRQPYGMLPAVALRSWSDPDPAAMDVYSVVNRLLPLWTSVYDTRLKGQLDFDALLERRPTSRELRARLAAIVGAVGATPAWLTAGNGLLSVGASPIQARLQSLAGWLGQIGQQLGLTGALSWPQGYVLLPDWTQSTTAPAWPVTNWSGGVPLAATGADPYLSALAARQTTPAVGSVVDALAASAWARTSVSRPPPRGRLHNGAPWAKQPNLRRPPRPTS